MSSPIKPNEYQTQLALLVCGDFKNDVFKAKCFALKIVSTQKKNKIQFPAGAFRTKMFKLSKRKSFCCEGNSNFGYPEVVGPNM